MAHPSSYILLNFIPILLILSQPQLSQSHPINHENTKVKTEVFLSPEIVLEPGLVSDKFYYNIDFSRGHIALKSVNAELVDERGNSVPLHQTYLHHWVLQKYYFRINAGTRVGNDHIDLGFQKPDQIHVKNSGLCNSLTQYYGLGAETRKTSTYVPDPYGVEVGNPVDIPVGYEERWVLNVHAIDTRGVEDKLGCIECRCDLFNVTEYEYDQTLATNYKGGLKCCHDETKCKLKKGFEDHVKRSLYLRYTVKYVDWDASIVPVKIYIIDVTDVWTKGDESKGVKERHNCVIEYDVEACPVSMDNDSCIHTKTSTVSLPAGGDLIYGVGHQHAAATAITLYGENVVTRYKHATIMAHPSSYILLNFIPILLILSQPQLSQSHPINHENTKVKTEVFLSPEIVLEPGLVSDKFYYNIDFSRGHIALKSVNAELVDERGNSVPLHQTYLHHWVLQKYYFRINAGTRVGNDHIDLGFQKPDQIHVKNSGLCNSLTQYYGLGAETRKTSTYVPDPYGVEVGNPVDIPVGYKERWVLNVHAIDTRGVEDKLGCIECRCDLFNVTEYEYDQTLATNYKGGLKCCHDETKCKLKKGFEDHVKRSLYLRYTVKYVDWDASIVPVKIYIIDVTDVWTKGDESKGVKERHNCVIEYDVEACPVSMDNDSCIHTKTSTVSLPAGGDLIYGVGHQHAAATAITLYGEGGRVICSSNPIYGKGDEPGDEAGYVVGMSTCYPLPGSVKISDGEMLTLVSNYSNEKNHTGVMGFSYILVADSLENHKKSTLYASIDVLKVMTSNNFVWPIVLFGVVVVAIVVFVFKGRTGRGEEGYEAII
ncbi:hypothetical protein CASFOL_037981 [Castilleja foliolosa]|uniref:Stress up-regulated Nod 19 protein n=1 Tax=Castilleja foliolosa TaxID=1961234 RepID=A0ABD3BJR4_9LAMI